MLQAEEPNIPSNLVQHRARTAKLCDIRHRRHTVHKDTDPPVVQFMRPCPQSQEQSEELSLDMVEKAHLLLEIDEHRALVEQSLEGHSTGESA